MKSTKVLIVEDSSIMREILSDILSADPDIEVLGTAPDVQIARRKIKELNPDVVTLDVELPGMDGISFLEKIMRLRPTPVVMISGYTQDNSEAAFRALEIGAVDVVGKSTVNLDTSLTEKSEEICQKVKGAALANFAGYRPNLDRPAPARAATAKPKIMLANKLVCIGASAGGVEAMRHVIERLPGGCPPILYAQHMPQEFTQRFAERLNEIGELRVQEAADQMEVLPGHVYLAPGGSHLKLKSLKGRYVCHVDTSSQLNGYRPSIDVLFGSVARVAGANAVGAILTGMGKDGAEGLLAMRQAGAITLGQDEATSLIYGMPRVAAEMGAVETQVPLRNMADKIVEACSRREPRKST